MLGLLCFAQNGTNAQTVVMNFNDGVPDANCWINVGFESHNGSGPDNSRSATTRGVASASLTTPFIDIPAGGTISFAYKASDNDFNYTLTVRLVSLTGSTTTSTLTITNTTYQTYTSPALAAGTYRVALDYSSNANRQLGQRYIDIDNLTISGSYHYSNFCNAAPVGVADTYTVTSFAASTVTGNVLTNDTDPNIATNGEILSVVSNTPVSAGTLTLDSDGNFVFTPYASFTGGPVTFTYTMSDNGYAPITSSPITVTINYPTAPVAVADDFVGPPTATSFTGNITGNDTKPSDKTLLTYLVQNPASGSVVLHADGTFTYTPPSSGFTGGDVTFAYRVSYDTYLPLYSNTVTVTISYPELIPTPLPIKLLSFTSQLLNEKVQLNWSVDDNETGNYFRVERSTDGRTFSEVTLIYANGKNGKQDYSFTEPIASVKGIYYRLKIVNLDGPPAYSKTIFVKPQLTTSANTNLTLLSGPASSTLRSTYVSDVQEQSRITVYNLNGARLLSQQTKTVKGLNYIELEVGTLPKGVYILEVSSPTITRKVKFVK